MTVASPPASDPNARDPKRGAALHEDVVIAIILGGLLLVLAIHATVSRWRHGLVELERRPEHRYDYRIDVNAATYIELLHLPGIGPSLARRILDDRDANGPYQSIDDLARVKGVGPRTSEGIAPYLHWPKRE